MHWRHKRERCARGPGRDGGPEWSEWRGMGQRWGRHHGGGMRRVFEQGDLRFVVLALIAEQPRHGYDIIKEVERRAGGAYSPSPGVIYPLLSMLDEMGLIEQREGEGAKKLYAVTAEGQAELAKQKDNVEALFARIEAVRERFAEGRAPQIIRAMENLKLALRLRIERGAMSEEQVSAIAAAIDAAAQAVERT